MEVQVSFSDGVSEKGQCRGVSGNPFMALDDHCGPIFHGIRQLARAIVSMNLHANALTVERNLASRPRCSKKVSALADRVFTWQSSVFEY